MECRWMTGSASSPACRPDLAYESKARAMDSAAVARTIFSTRVILTMGMSPFAFGCSTPSRR
jgi:hypothetical protein